MRFIKTILLLFIAASFTMTAKAEDVDALIQKMIKSSGGAENFENVKTWYAEIEQTNSQMPQPQNVTVWFKKPNKIKLEQNVMGQKLVLSTNGEKVWMINPMAGSSEPQEVPSEQAASLTNLVGIFDIELADYKAKGYALEYVELVENENESFHKIKATDADGNVTYYFLDPITALIKRNERTVSSPQGEINVVTEIVEKQKVNGLILPKSMEVSFGPQTQNVVIKKVEVDKEIPDSTFDMPQK